MFSKPYAYIFFFHPILVKMMCLSDEAISFVSGSSLSLYIRILMIRVFVFHAKWKLSSEILNSSSQISLKSRT